MRSRETDFGLWADALAMLDEADRLQRQFFQLTPARGRAPCWEPPVDMMETGRRIFIVVALPGVAPAELQIVVDGHRLRVVGERPMPSHPDARLRRLEIPYGRFERTIELPAGRFEIEQRDLEHGCLRLILRKLV